MFMHFKGLYTALITPFMKDEMLDLQGFIQLIEQQNSARVDGIVVLGTTGEAPSLNHEERLILIRTAIEHANVPVIVGTGSNSTQQTIENTKEAELLGADGALIVTPYYNKPTQEGLFKHYEAVHAATKLPIMLYNVPSRCGVNLFPETVLKLASLDRIKGIKDASGSIAQLSEILEATSKKHPEFAVLTGDDAMILPSIALGAVGVVSVLSNLYPERIKEFVDTCLNGKFRDAREHHYTWMPLIRGIFAETNPMLVKAAMSHLGMPAGACRLPLSLGSEINIDRIVKLLQELKNHATI